MAMESGHFPQLQELCMIAEYRFSAIIKREDVGMFVMQK